MTVFNYGGVELDLDWLISYARVSSPAQTLEQGGGGIERQIEEFHAFRTEFGVEQDISLGSLVDEGKSGSTGQNVKTGALGLFLKAIKGKRVKPKTGLVVESFSRLNRLHIDEALDVFFDIVCKGGVALVTLQDRRAYTKKSVRNDKGRYTKSVPRCTPRGTMPRTSVTTQLNRGAPGVARPPTTDRRGSQWRPVAR